MEALLNVFSGSTSHGLGDSARDRVKTALILVGVGILGIAILIAIVVLISK
ncbi:hypothetical protein ACNQVK_16105 [Mycobacterium sp. 134]|uniref:hypothetical protein n=1 Tax=Mycobacterium sp. 134 TaxID=3400425 RepID=UPI003AAD8FCA